MGVISQNGIDYPVPSVPVQSDGSATDLTNAAVPTGQTIKSYLNSNLITNLGQFSSQAAVETALSQLNAQRSAISGIDIAFNVAPASGIFLQTTYIGRFYNVSANRAAVFIFMPMRAKILYGNLNSTWTWINIV